MIDHVSAYSFQVGVSGAHSASVTSLRILVVWERRQGTGSVMENLVDEPSRLKKEFATTKIARDAIILLIFFLRTYIYLINSENFVHSYLKATSNMEINIQLHSLFLWILGRDLVPPFDIVTIRKEAEP